MKVREFFAGLVDNLPFKLLSLAAAVILYFSYQIVSLDSKSFSIPLRVNDGGNFVLAEDPPQFVRVTVRGKPEQIAAVQKNDIQAYIDTSLVSSEGNAVLPVLLDLKDYFTLMDPLDVQVKPNRLILNCEPNVYKSVQIQPFFLGTLPDGYEIASQSIEPQNIKIAGAKSIVESTDVLYTGSIDLQNKTKSFTAFVTIENNLKNIRIPDNQRAEVKVEIKAQDLTRSLSLRVQAVYLNPAFRPAKELQKINMVLSGAKKSLSAFIPDVSTVQADFTHVNGIGTYTVPLRINIPNEFSIVSINPPVLQVEIIEKESVTFPPDDFADEDFGSHTIAALDKKG
ncbi:hypothetical protein H0R92_02020 [Treponema sp. OMZ 840]|uniref:CdaR family protein n=1 Tax=Treponema sp. OMZ 840 TaxID=244313 RepID=UPI003D8CED4A